MKDCYKTTAPDRYGLLKVCAKNMRNKPTEAESLLWQYLRGGQLGAKFRRQHAIGDYIVDFVCLSSQLVIELDGGVHENLSNKEHDELRDKRLTELGYKILRFKNEDLFSGIDNVLSKIKENINDR